jgi:hypothetical protein
MRSAFLFSTRKEWPNKTEGIDPISKAEDLDILLILWF